MMIPEDQQDEKPEGAMVLGEDIQLSAVVNVDWSNNFLAMHITRENKTLC